MAEAGQVPCKLVHVVDRLMFGLAVPGTPPSLSGLIARNARREVERALRGAVPEPVLQKLEVQLGRPSHELSKLAAGSSVLVLGGKRHTVLGRWVVGSTAHELSGELAVPLLIAGPAGDTPYRILVAADLTAAMEPVLAEARRIARLFRSDLAVLHVIEPIVLAYSSLDLLGAAAGEVLSDEDWARASASTFERAIWPAVNYPMAEKIIRRGPIVDTIRHEVESWRADLLVLGSHSKGWAERLWAGSTTGAFLGDLPTSILVVPKGVPAAPVPVRKRNQEVLWQGSIR
jgi:nucleotide-binding universal stress UspA family protein